MTNPIQNLALPPVAPTPLGGAAPASADNASFSSLLVESLGQVNAMQQEAGRAVESLATGGDISPAEVLSAVQKADLAFRLTMQIRNKLVQAYQEVQNIRV